VYKIRWRKVRRPCNLSLSSTLGYNSSWRPATLINSLSHTSGNKHLRSGLKPHRFNFCPASTFARPSWSS
jgi:hypothetical protein